MSITYIQNIRNIKNVTLHKSFFGVFLFALLFGLLPFANSDFLKGELFSPAEEDSLAGSASVFDITDYSAEAGETGEISIVATQDVDPILGFSLNIDFSSAGMQYNGISTEGTVLDGKNFFIQGNDNTDDILAIAAATGDSGVSISAGDILAKISFTLNQSIPSSTSSLALDIENMKIIGTDMIEKSVSGGEGIISILHPENTLDIQSFEMSANGSLEIVFSELVSDITLDDITFIPEAVTDFSTVTVVGDTVTFSRLDFAGGEQYSLSFLPSFLGQNGDAVSESLTTLTFHVPHDSTPIFTITDTAIISNTEIKISFSEAVKESSIELNDFLSKTLAFEDFTVSEDKKSILVTLSETTVISDLVHPDPLSIEYMESESGKPLKGYLTDVFNYTGLGPQMTHSVRNSEESITVFFENALLESSIDISSFELFKFTNVNECPAYPNLIDENTVMSVAEDGLSITFSGLSLRNIEEYVIMIEAETVQDREGDMVAYHQLKRVQNTVAEQYDEDFFISNLEVLSDVSLQVTLSKEPDAESVNALYASIENALEDLTITSLVQNSSNKKIIDITTSVQTPNTPYVLQFDPQYWKTTAGDILGGKNSFLFTSGEETLVFSLQSVSPYRFIQGVTEKLTIEGANIPDTFSVYAGTYELTKKTLSADKKTLTLSVPDNILEGVYDLKFKWSENEVDKVLDFPEAFIVEEEDIDEIIVISEKSYASPEKVKNDGSDTTTLYVYIDDTRGLADLEKVSVDLRELDGAAAVSLTAGAVENGMQVWILENITVPETVPTSTTPYKLPIIAQNQSGLHDAGYVSVWVSRDTTSSIAPVITSFSITPNIATPADSDHPLLISSEIKDEDGGEDITTVAVDLSPVQLNTIFLTPRNQGQESAKTRFFESTEDIVIPESVADGEYSITLTAIDAQGEETKSTIPLTVKRDTAMGPSMSSGDSYVTPSNKILKDGIFSFQIHTKVTDPSGADNITSVSANLSDLGLPPVALTGGVIEGRSQWFSSSSLIVPDSAMVGKREIVITATDKEGNDSVHDIDVQVLYSAGQGRSPVVESDQNYITPVEVLNDGESTFAAYIFVKDLDSDVSHVVLKLGNTALFAGNELPLGTSSKTTQGEEQCVSTRTLLCMQPIMKESTGQWYYLSDLVITKTTPARDKPYELEVLAVDSNGNTGEGTLSIPVRTVSTLLQDGTNTVTVAQSISNTEIQVLFERAIDPVSVKKDAFVLSFAEDKNSLIPITDMTISPDGKVVTLKTNPQEAGKNYALTMDPESIGLSFESLADTVFSVPGFDSSNASKALKLVHSQSVSAEEMSLTFSDPIDAMSILNTENFQIITSGTKEILEITSLEMSDKYTISLKTVAQSAGASYDLYYKNISSIYGDIIDKRKTVKMDAYKAPLGEGLAQLNGTADFNSDGIVDFTDFTLFAAVYGKTYEESASGDLNGDTTVDFSDFTLFSSQYGDVLDPNGDSGNNGSTTDNMHGSATAITDGNTTNPSSGIGGSTSQATRPAPTALVYSATPSPAPTPTITSTSTPTPTATSTATASPTPLATGYTFTSTPTPTATATSTQTATPTPTSTVSPTASASATLTITPSPSATATPTVSATPSPSDDGSDLDMECTDDPLVCLLM